MRANQMIIEEENNEDYSFNEDKFENPFTIMEINDYVS